MVLKKNKGAVQSFSVINIVCSLILIHIKYIDNSVYPVKYYTKMRHDYILSVL